MTNQSEGPAVGKAEACEHCARPIGYGGDCCRNHVDNGRMVSCYLLTEKRLRAELATAREGRTHLEEAAELLKRRPTILDGIQGLYDWMQDVESWKARDQSPTPAEALSAEEPAPVAEAEGRVTHAGARLLVRAAWKSEATKDDLLKLTRYIDQQESALSEAERKLAEVNAHNDRLVGYLNSEKKQHESLRRGVNDAIAMAHDLDQANIGSAEEIEDFLRAILNPRFAALADRKREPAGQEPIGGEPARPHCPSDFDKCANPKCRHLRANHRKTCLMLDCPCEAFEPAKPARQAEQKLERPIAFRGSVTDLATDVAFELTPAQTAELIQELERFRASEPTKFCKTGDVYGAEKPAQAEQWDQPGVIIGQGNGQWQSEATNPAGERGDFRVGQPAQSRCVIVVQSGRCGGSPTLGNTRLPLRQFVAQVRAGWTDKQLHENWDYVPLETWAVVRAIASELSVIPDDDYPAEAEAEQKEPTGAEQHRTCSRGCCCLTCRQWCDCGASDGGHHHAACNMRKPCNQEPADPVQPQPQGGVVTRAELVAALNKLGNLGGILTADKPGYWFAKLAEELESTKQP